MGSAFIFDLYSDLVIHLTKMTGDLDIPWNRKIIGHQAGQGYKVQGSRFKVKCLALFFLPIDSFGLM